MVYHSYRIKKQKKKKILIIGITGALGASLEKILIKNNFKVIGFCKTKRNKKSYISVDFKKNILNSVASNILKKNKFDYIINTVGLYSDQPFIKMSLKNILDMFSVNVLSFLNIILEINRFNNLKDLKIININSIAGIEYPKNECIYSSTKHALKAFTEIFAHQISNKNVEIIDMYPGAFKSRITKKRGNYDKLMGPDEIAKLIYSNSIKSTVKNIKIKNIVFTRDFLKN